MHSEIESELRNTIFSNDIVMIEGLTHDRQLLYRKLVRNNLFNSISAQLSLTMHHAGQKRFHGWFNEWLSRSPPCERIYWKLPIEFALWFRQNVSEENVLHSELAHFEAMQVSCANAPNHDGPRTLDLASPSFVQMDPSCRLCFYHFPVYLIKTSDETLPSRLAVPDFVLMYRRSKTSIGCS